MLVTNQLPSKIIQKLTKWKYVWSQQIDKYYRNNSSGYEGCGTTICELETNKINKKNQNKYN